MPAKILVVDDEAHFERLILQRFRRKVRSNAYAFVFAQNGLQALEKLKENNDFDIILTDINMPQMDGLTFLSRLYEQEAKVKVIVVSAYGDMQNIRTAMNLGAFDFVTKPINFEDLEITIQKALRETEMFRLAEEARQKLILLQQELTVANEIQQSILPKDFSFMSTDNHLEIYAKMIPAKEVGGDFYDFFLIDKQRLAIVIGDVSGKGMPAALFMAISRTLLKATALKDMPVQECLEQVNSLLSQDNPARMFVTVFYAVLNLENGELEYCSGGHNPPLLLHPDGRSSWLDDSQNMFLGVQEGMQYASRKTTLKPGAGLVLYTDGVTEALNKEGDFFSEDRLMQFLENHPGTLPEAIVTDLVEEVQRFSNDVPQSDDITILALRKINDR